MPDNQSSAAQPESGAEPAEFNFDKPATENPRMKRRSLKAKPAGLTKPPASTLSAARELEREAPPRSAEASPPDKPKSEQPPPAKAVPVVVRLSTTPSAPPRSAPSGSSATSQPASGTGAKPVPPSSATSTPTISPHGTRPATLYYSSHPRKEKEATSPMKSIPSANSASSSAAPASAAATPTRSASANPPPSAARTSPGASPRPAPNIDYRANVERQSREQKSVGNILAYLVYALIAFFVLGAGLAGYGTYTLSRQIHDENVTVTDLDQRYAAANKILTTNLATTQESLTQAQAQIARQQDVILKQQEELNRLIAATNANLDAIKAEKQARAQETTSLRARVRDLENRETIFH